MLGSWKPWECLRTPRVKGHLSKCHVLLTLGLLPSTSPAPLQTGGAIVSWVGVRWGQQPPVPSAILHHGLLCYYSGPVMWPNPKTSVLSLLLSFGICIRTNYQSMSDLSTNLPLDCRPVALIFALWNSEVAGGTSGWHSWPRGVKACWPRALCPHFTNFNQGNYTFM